MRDKLIALGFEELPHRTITNSLYYNLGRNRSLSFGDIGRPNEMLFLCQHDDKDYRIITDLVCLRNFDYEGYTSYEDIVKLISLINPPQSTTKRPDVSGEKTNDTETTN